MGLIMLDLDGTLVADALVESEGAGGGKKLGRRQHELYHQPVLLENRLNVLAKAAEDGDCFAIVTNQGGVAWGYHTQAECYERIACALRQLAFFGGRPFSVHVCFSHERATVDGFKSDAARRKPSPAMLLEALDVHGPAIIAAAGGVLDRELVRANALMVGDREEDSEAAAAAGVDFVGAGDFFGC